MKKKLLMVFASWMLVLCMAEISSADLVAQGDGTIYDTDLNISWLADANLVISNNFGVTPETDWGGMWWNTAKTWIDGMNTDNYLGHSDWRLPNSDAACTGYLNCNTTNNEMAHLFYTELGGQAFTSLATTHNDNYLLFQNLDSRYWYFDAAGEFGDAYYFDFSSGNQGNSGNTSQYFALAVHSGPSSSVPLPGALWLLGSGLAGLVGFQRRRIQA